MDHGVAGVLTPRRNRDQLDANYWVIFEVESLQNARFLAEAEQVRIYACFKLFLDGLGFPLKCISLVEAADAMRDPALVAQRHALSELSATPQLQKLQQQSLQHQHGSLQHCTTTRHFVVISASTSELARQRGDGTARSPLLRLFELVAPKKQPAATPEQVKNELRIRVSLVKKALQHLDVQATVLDNAEALQVYASCLALLYGETLSLAQEAFLTHAARAAYAAKGITMEAIRRDPKTLLREPPVFADLIAAMKDVPASSESMRQMLLERFEHVAYLFPGQTTVEITCPLTIFNIHTLDEKWYPLMIYVVQNFLQRHRALRRDDRYLAYVVEEASYMLKHPAGKRYLESGSRGFRKLGIAQFTLSQHPTDFLEDGQVIISNAGTCFFLGMQRHAAQKLKLAEELERVLEEGVPGRAILRCGREYSAIDVAKQSPLHRAIFTIDPRERRLLQEQKQRRQAAAHQQGAS